MRKGSLRMKHEPNYNAKLLKEQISEQHCRAKELWVCLDETTPLLKQCGFFKYVCACVTADDSRFVFMLSLHEAQKIG